jgi:hypothetical protein
MIQIPIFLLYQLIDNYSFRNEIEVKVTLYIILPKWDKIHDLWFFETIKYNFCQSNLQSKHAPRKFI